MFNIAFECIDDGNNFGYKPECDPDINQFDTGDLKNLTTAGIGTAGREVIVNLDLIVILVLFGVVITLIAVFIAKAKGLFGLKPF